MGSFDRSDFVATLPDSIEGAQDEPGHPFVVTLDLIKRNQLLRRLLRY